MASDGSHVKMERGRDTTFGDGKKNRGSSRTHPADHVLGEMGERMEMAEHNIETLENHVLEQLESVKENTQSCINASMVMEDRFARLEARMRDVIQALQANIDEMKEDLLLCKKATVNGAATITAGSSMVDCPKPTTFNGVRDAKEVENFLWKMEQYFEAINLTDEGSKVKSATLYLTDTTMLWWRRKHADIEKSSCRIDTWDEFKNELKRHFYPENVVYEAQRKLRELKQRGAICDYVNEFTTLTLQIPNLSEEDLLFFFIDYLESWAKQELQRRKIHTVDEAIAAAESLTEFLPYPTSDQKEKWNSGKGGGGRHEKENRDPRKELPSMGGR